MVIGFFFHNLLALARGEFSYKDFVACRIELYGTTESSSDIYTQNGNFFHFQKFSYKLYISLSNGVFFFLDPQINYMTTAEYLCFQLGTRYSMPQELVDEYFHGMDSVPSVLVMLGNTGLAGEKDVVHPTAMGGMRIEQTHGHTRTQKGLHHNGFRIKMKVTNIQMDMGVIGFLFIVQYR